MTTRFILPEVCVRPIPNRSTIVHTLNSQNLALVKNLQVK